MIGFMLCVAILAAIYAGYVCIVEAWCEKDWPRKSAGSFGLIVFSILCLAAAF